MAETTMGFSLAEGLQLLWNRHKEDRILSNFPGEAPKFHFKWNDKDHISAFKQKLKMTGESND